MKVFNVALFLLLYAYLPASARLQNRPTWSKEELTMANTAKTAAYLTGEEKDMVMYMNLARMNGEKFFLTFFQDFVESHNKQMSAYSNYNSLRIERSSSYYRSLEKDLQNVKDLPMLYPDEAMSWVARQHAKDMNKYNYAEHTARDGRTVKDRITAMYPKKACGENLAFGFSSGLGNICMLLLDKGVPNLGHRKIIIDTSYKFNYIGVSIQPHKSYKYCSVTDFVALP
ncbi:CAP domain-containing protein [Pedobacter sp. GR22-6]|uniref:CAP domain-containing protein n=1 Tax=Pedobacter sp. GR22-6 TaxID=3127957 RepID=UPI00307F8777